MRITLHTLFGHLEENTSNETSFIKNLNSFITQGGDVNAISQDHEDRTLLHATMQLGWVKAVTRLLEHKADLTIRNYHGEPVCFALVENTTLQSAIRFKIFELLAYYAPHQLHTPGKRAYTPLHIAADQKDTHMIQLLLDYNADIDACNEYDKTALDIAIERQHSTAVKILLKASHLRFTHRLNAASKEAVFDEPESTALNRLRC